VTDSAALTDTAGVTDTAGITATAEITGTHGPYTEAEALTLANELRERILAGEDFAALAKAYSDDTSSGANGGDLGWFGRNAMVAPFEEAAFSLAVGEVSEPVKTDFGYHLIEVLERDDARPKDESQLQQERAQAFSAWLTEQMANNQIERAGDISALLPPGL
jgi:parvulin-like peptidyl-prolyl isomerase